MHGAKWGRAVRGFTLLLLPLVWLTVLCGKQAQAQQFNSDSYLSKPHGMATIILTVGERNSIFMNTFSLFPRWEFTAAAYIYNGDANKKTNDGYSTTFYGKYMFYENKAKTGGFAVKAGTGIDPGYLATVGLQDAFQTYWMNAPTTLPLFDNRLSWDIMPGASVTLDYGGWQASGDSLHLLNPTGLVRLRANGFDRGRGIRCNRRGGDHPRV